MYVHILFYVTNKHGNLRVSMGTSKTELHSDEREGGRGRGGERRFERKFMRSAVRVPGVSTEYGIIPGGVVGS